MAKRKREEEAAEEERNIKRTTAIQARMMWLVEFAKKDAVEAEKQAYWEITGKKNVSSIYNFYKNIIRIVNASSWFCLVHATDYLRYRSP